MSKRPKSPTSANYSYMTTKYLKIDDPFAIIRIEYCETKTPFSAITLFDQLHDLLPEYTVQAEVVEGIRESFEVFCRKANGIGKGVLVWSGFEKETWEEKVPEARTLLPAIREVLK